MHGATDVNAVFWGTVFELFHFDSGLEPWEFVLQMPGVTYW